MRRDCLIHALLVPEEFGVFGGYSPAERKRMKRYVDPRGRLKPLTLIRKILDQLENGNLAQRVIKL